MKLTPSASGKTPEFGAFPARADAAWAAVFGQDLVDPARATLVTRVLEEERVRFGLSPRRPERRS